MAAASSPSRQSRSDCRFAAEGSHVDAVGVSDRDRLTSAAHSRSLRRGRSGRSRRSRRALEGPLRAARRLEEAFTHGWVTPARGPVVFSEDQLARSERFRDHAGWLTGQEPSIESGFELESVVATRVLHRHRRHRRPERCAVIGWSEQASRWPARRKPVPCGPTLELAFRRPDAEIVATHMVQTAAVRVYRGTHRQGRGRLVVSRPHEQQD